VNVATELRRIGAQLHAVEALLDEGEEKLGRRAPRVSGWSVAEQLDHVTKVLEAALARLLAESPPLGQGINLVGRVLLAIGRIPRGVGKSPAAVRGAERSAAELRAAVERVRALLASVAADGSPLAGDRPVFRHPYFAGLTPGQTLRFLSVHTDHHLRIVADIRRATGV
jgi:hypothetical protein